MLTIIKIVHFVSVRSVGLDNKSKTIFHGLYSYRLKEMMSKCSKIKWNYEPYARGLNAKF